MTAPPPRVAISGAELAPPPPPPYAQLRRAIDRGVALGGLIAAAPLIAAIEADARRRGRPAVSIQRLGQHHRRFRELRYALPPGALGRLMAQLRVDRLPLLVNLWRGEVSLVGPRPWAPREATAPAPALHRRHDVAPGLLSLWWVKQRANVAFDDELSADLEYVTQAGPWRDATLVLNGLLGLLHGEARGTPGARVELLRVAVDNLRMKDALQRIDDWLAGDAGPPRHVAFVNAHYLNVAHVDEGYRAALAQADLVLADGIGVRLAAGFKGQQIVENVNGTDMLPRLCERLAGRRLFLLGGVEGAAAGTAAWIAERFPDVVLVGARSGHFPTEQEQAVVQQVAHSRPDVLLVGMGVPRQELFLARHKHALGARVAIGVGGLLDFYSGRIPRAPVWLREAGLEWVFRLVQEPGRMWRRYLVGNGAFLWRALRQPAAGGAGTAARKGDTR